VFHDDVPVRGSAALISLSSNEGVFPMLMRINLFPSLAAGILAVGLLVGCNRSEQADVNGVATSPEAAPSGEAHDPHDVPLTEDEIAQLKEETAQYEAAIERIQQYQETIERETTAGEPAHAHRALDNLDVVLERLPEAASNSGVPRDRWQEVNETAQKLRDLFNQVHANIDAGEDPDYASVAEEIDQGIQTLAAIEPAPTE
jgi:hypothetical protein